MKKKFLLITTLLFALTIGQTFAEVNKPIVSHSSYVEVSNDNPDREWGSK